MSDQIRRLTKAEKELAKSPSMSALIAPPSAGDHVYRVQLKTPNGKYLSVEPSHILTCNTDSNGPETIFELHQYPSTSTTLSSTSGTRISLSRFALRSPLGRFLNVDENIKLAIKEKTNKEPGFKADRDGGENGAALTEREKGFEMIECENGTIALRTPDEYFLAIETNDNVNKLKLSKNATYVANVAAAAATNEVKPNTVASASTTVTSTAAPASAPPAIPASSPTFVPAPIELFTPVWLDDRSPLTLCGCYLIHTAHRSLLWCAEPDGRLIANRPTPMLWEPITLESTGLTQVAFLSYHGKYLTYQPIGRQLLEFTADTIGANERFEVIELDKPNGTYAFKTSGGGYICAQGNHTVTATGKQMGPWEIFHLAPYHKE